MELTATDTDVAKLHEIAVYLESSIGNLPPSPGVTNGKSGAALFFYTYALWVNDDPKYIDLSEKVLLSAIQDLYTAKASGPLYYTDIAELGMLISYLQQEGFLDRSFDDVLAYIDTQAIIGAQQLCAQCNFDRFTGYLTIGRYFLTRDQASNADVRRGIQHIIDTLIRSALNTNSGSIYWESKLFNSNDIYLGWSHGVASVILLLLELMEKGIDYKTYQLNYCISAACQYLIENKVYNSDSFFPDIVGEEKSNSPLNLCYGDLGINYAILKAGETIRDRCLYDEGMSGLLQSASRRSLQTCNVHDASVIYGTSGLVTLFNALHDQYSTDAFAEAAAYWYDVMHSQIQQPGKPAGYSGYYNQTNPHVNLTLYEGLPGLGLALIARQAGPGDLIRFIGY